MSSVRIVVRCVKNKDHAKTLSLGCTVDGVRKTLKRAKELVEILDGTSKLYIHPPGEDSPIARCAICGGTLECELKQMV